MIKIIFKISADQDAKNWLRVSRMINPPYKLVKKKIIRTKIKDFTAKDIEALKKSKRRLEEFFKKNGNIIFLYIKKLTQKPIYTNTFYATFTTAGLMPYDTRDSWFMVPAQKSIIKQASVVIHELLHLQVANYYIKYCLQKGLSQQQFLELNEIVTSITIQQILKKLNLPIDKGYPKHKKINDKLAKYWTNKANFNDLIDKSITLTKNSNN